MDWLSLLNELLIQCIYPLIGILSVFLIKFICEKSAQIKDKIENDTADKYITMLNDTICSCVKATTQTYVENLKKQNAFTEEAQRTAFEKTFNAVMAILTEDAKKYLANIYGDLTEYISTRIEAEVKNNKK